jgi:ankyrin repeat protein
VSTPKSFHRYHQAHRCRFLWVALQLDEICRQTSDDNIRLTVRQLPKDLRETYARMLFRIQLDEKASLALQAFKWVAVSQRPLTLPELKEALAVERFAKFSRPERMVNDPSRIIPWCEGLLMLHEDGEIQFSHPTVKEVLTDNRESSRVGDFSFTLFEADKEVGELCVTYLDFNDFKTQLVKASKPRHLPARTVIESSMPTNINKGLAKALLKLSLVGSRSSRDSPDVLRPFAQAHRGGNGNSSVTTAVQHPFLAYASRHWLAHSCNFQQNDRIWSLWRSMATEDERLAVKPWTTYDWIHNKRTISSYIIRLDHVALFRVVFHVDYTADHKEIAWLLESAVHTGHVVLVRAVLELSFSRKINLNRVLQAAAEGGHLDVVERLLASKADVNAAAAKDLGCTALQAAAGGGHLDVVERLLAAKADVNAAAVLHYGRTALQAAAGGGHLDVVERLLAAKADVNAAAAEDFGRTALQAAAEGGHLDVIERLLAAKADVNAAAAKDLGCTALQAAAGGGHLDVVERLLAAKAVVNAAAAGHSGRTALQAAAEGGHLDVVESRGTQGSSACRVYNKEECLRGQVTGTEPQEMTVFQGDRVYAQAAYIQFRSANETSSPGLQV